MMYFWDISLGVARAYEVIQGCRGIAADLTVSTWIRIAFIYAGGIFPYFWSAVREGAVGAAANEILFPCGRILAQLSNAARRRVREALVLTCWSRFPYADHTIRHLNHVREALAREVLAKVEVRILTSLIFAARTMPTRGPALVNGLPKDRVWRRGVESSHGAADGLTMGTVPHHRALPARDARWLVHAAGELIRRRHLARLADVSRHALALSDTHHRHRLHVRVVAASHHDAPALVPLLVLPTRLLLRSSPCAEQGEGGPMEDPHRGRLCASGQRGGRGIDGHQ